MERAAFTLLHESERSWWYRGRAKIVQSVLRTIRSHDLSILDFGAGYGGMKASLMSHGSVKAYEPDAEARTILQEKGYTEVYSSIEEALANSYDLLALFDVLEHLEDDVGFLRKAHTALNETGKTVLTVPATPFLWSAHDISHHHFRRYTRRTLRVALEKSGYEIEHMSYWNTFLFLPAAFTRLLGKSGAGAFRLPPFLDAFFYMLIRIEAFIMRYIPLPFGVSLVVLARKK